MSLWTTIFFCLCSFSKRERGPLSMLKPRFSSSLYSWHSAQLSQKKWTQQSRQGDSCKSYCARIEERLVQAYHQQQDMDVSKTYRVPFMQHAGNKESANKIDDFYAWTLVQMISKTPTCWASINNLSNATKCNAGAQASQATCNIRKKMKHRRAIGIHCYEIHA